jgi:hypothetical protein
MRDDTIGGVQLDFQEIWIMHERILLLSTGHNNRGMFLNLLGEVCLHQWRAFKSMYELNQGISAYDDSVRDGLTDADSLAELGVALLYRIEQLGDVQDIAKCVSLMEKVVQLAPEGHPDKPSWLCNLANCLLSRFKHLGDLDDLNRAVLIRENAVCLTPDSHPDKSSYLNNLGGSLLTRFEHLGDLDDLNRSVSIQETAVYLTPNDDCNKLLCLI